MKSSFSVPLMFAVLLLVFVENEVRGQSGSTFFNFAESYNVGAGIEDAYDERAVFAAMAAEYGYQIRLGPDGTPAGMWVPNNTIFTNARPIGSTFEMLPKDFPIGIDGVDYSRYIYGNLNYGPPLFDNGSIIRPGAFIDQFPVGDISSRLPQNHRLYIDPEMFRLKNGVPWESIAPAGENSAFWQSIRTRFPQFWDQTKPHIPNTPDFRPAFIAVDTNSGAPRSKPKPRPNLGTGAKCALIGPLDAAVTMGGIVTQTMENGAKNAEKGASMPYTSGYAETLFNMGAGMAYMALAVPAASALDAGNAALGMEQPFSFINDASIFRAPMQNQFNDYIEAETNPTPYNGDYSPLFFFQNSGGPGSLSGMGGT